MAPLLEVIRISKSYPGLPVLKEASFTAEMGEILCILGPSGGGKTTLLRIIAGLEQGDTGQVLFEGRNLAGVPVHLRKFGFMFQDYALFPHRDVAENVAFGLRMQGLGKEAIRERVGEALALVELSGYERRRVVELSGGEQQRVALARSLAPRPRLLMLDEPLGSLDRALREQLMNQLRDILKHLGLTALYVTHDQGEAFAVADRVLIMRSNPEGGEGGWIEQDGAPADVYRNPSTPYVARFLGFKNLLPGNIRENGTVDTAIGLLTVDSRNCPISPTTGPVTVLIRPEAADALPAGARGLNVIEGRLLDASFRGSYYLLRTEHAGQIQLVTEISGTDTHLPKPGEPIALHLDPTAIIVLPERR